MLLDSNILMKFCLELNANLLLGEEFTKSIIKLLQRMRNWSSRDNFSSYNNHTIDQ